MLFPKEVFLSHSSADDLFATRLVEVLRAHRIPIWFSQTDIVGSEKWHDEIGAALKRCDWFLPILSPNSVNSIWVKRELVFALQQKQYEILPLLLSPCDYGQLSWTLAQYQMIKFDEGVDTGYRELLRIWGIAYRPTI